MFLTDILDLVVLVLVLVLRLVLVTESSAENRNFAPDSKRLLRNSDIKSISLLHPDSHRPIRSASFCGCSYGNHCSCYHGDASEDTDTTWTFWLGPVYIQGTTNTTTCFTRHHLCSPVFFFHFFSSSALRCRRRCHAEREWVRVRCQDNHGNPVRK